MRTVLLAVLLTATSASAAEFDFSAMAGAGVPLLSDSGGVVGTGVDDGKTTVSPIVLVTVEAPISTFSAGPTLVVGAEYGAAPGESLDASDPSTYRSLSFRVGAHQPLSGRLNFGLYAECGFETRFSGDTAPRDRAPRWCGGGLRFKGHASELVVTLNADQRLASMADLPVAALAYRPTVGIRGQVPLLVAKTGKLAGGQVSVYVKAILGMEMTSRGAPTAPVSGRHDVVVAGVLMGF